MALRLGGLADLAPSAVPLPPGTDVFTRAFRAAAATTLELPRDLRPKNAYNLIRLLDLAIRWLGSEPPAVRSSDQIRPTLIAIKRAATGGSL
jgi:hypothetical protein